MRTRNNARKLLAAEKFSLPTAKGRSLNSHVNHGGQALFSPLKLRSEGLVPATFPEA